MDVIHTIHANLNYLPYIIFDTGFSGFIGTLLIPYDGEVALIYLFGLIRD